MVETNWVNYHGVPGSGKTRTMIAAFSQTVRKVGPERVGYVSFTRTAAEEARQRAAHSLGMPAIYLREPKLLRTRLPFVGTIHSLCYRLLGVSRDQMVNRTKLKDFADLMKTAEPKNAFEYVPEELDAPYLLIEGKDDLSAMQLLCSTAAHRMITLEEALDIIPVEYVEQIGEDRLLELAARYAQWKTENNYLDFDDLLLLGSKATLPVQCLIADEVQDNSKLLWHVIDQWASRIPLVICAGDPFQAIYLFNGADPTLFLDRPGRWVHLDTTHRFAHDGTEYARRVLANAFSTEETKGLDGWTGVGGEPKDGTTLCLARTNFLLNVFAGEFASQGIPFGYLKGKKGPLDREEADAYRTAVRLIEGGVVPASDLLPLAQSGMKFDTRPIKAQGSRDIDRAGAEMLIGRPLPYVMDYIPNVGYFDAIVKNLGTAALFSPPKYQLSTIHGAKGREADRVILLRGWGWIPGRALGDYEGARAECCVAYVGATRHRTELEVWDEGQGISYPFPG